MFNAFCETDQISVSNLRNHKLKPWKRILICDYVKAIFTQVYEYQQYSHDSSKRDKNNR